MQAPGMDASSDSDISGNRCECDFRADLFLNIDEVWDIKAKAFEILAAQKHLWEYYTRVGLNRGMQGSRNTGVPMTYGEAYQRLFPAVLETLS